MIENRIKRRLLKERFVKVFLYIIISCAVFLYVGSEVIIRFNVINTYDVIITTNESSEMHTVTDKNIYTLLNELDIDVDDNDIIYIDTSRINYEDLRKAMTSNVSIVEVIIVDIEVQKNEEVVPYEEIVKYDSSLMAGVEEITIKGVNGSVLKEVTLVYHDGKLYESKVAEISKTEPVNSVKIVGTKVVSSPGVTSNTSNGTNSNNSIEVSNGAPDEGNNSVPPDEGGSSECTITINGVSYPC